MSRGWNAWSRVYPALEYLVHGQALTRARRSGWRPPEGPATILVLGEGVGRFLADAVTRAPEARFVVVDGSEGMLARARARVGEAARGRVSWHCCLLPQEVESLPGGPFDMVVSQFFFDCFTDPELAQWWPQVAARLRPGGDWWVTDYSPPGDLTGWNRTAQRLLLWALYTGFGWTTPLRARRLPDFPAPFRGADWCLVERGQTARKLCAWWRWRKPCLAGGG